MPWHTIGEVRLFQNIFFYFIAIESYLFQIIYVFMLIIKLNPDILSKFKVFLSKKIFWVFSWNFLNTVIPTWPYFLSALNLPANSMKQLDKLQVPTSLMKLYFKRLRVLY